MKKQLLIIAAALMMAVCVQARIITPAENQVWWGYFSESDFETRDYIIGTGSAMTLMAGIYIPANHKQLGKATIQAVRVYLAPDVVSSLSNMKIWISKKLPSVLSDADIVQTTSGSLTAGANDFKLNTEYEINNEGFYIGYSVKSTTGYFIRCGGTDAANAFWIGNPDAGMSWTDLNGQGLGKLAFQILIEGGTFPSNNAIVEDFGQNLVLQGEEASIPITIKNMGINPIETISYTITTEGGNTTEEKEVSLGSLPLNGSKTVNIPFKSDTEYRKYKKTFTITQVDGNPNTASNNSATGFLITLKEKYTATPVIEEFTGTWCQYCPRGMVGMEKVHETYGDQVVQIAAHYDDPMAISAYSSIISSYCDGFPSSVIDRMYESDPSFSELKKVLSVSLNRVAPAAVDLSAQWDSDAKNKVVFNTTTNFSYSDDSGQYGIAFVLVEDGLTGTGSNWAQKNAYSGNGTGDMAWWGRQGTSVTGVKYNHVAVAGWSVKTGVTNSVNSNIDANVTQKFTYTGSISSNAVIQDKSKLKAIAMLIDKTTGRIVNAAQSAIADFATDIQTVEKAKDNEAGDTYDLSGRRLSNFQKGINIIRMSDGTAKKVLIK